VPKSSIDIETPRSSDLPGWRVVRLGFMQQDGFGDLEIEPLRRQADAPNAK